MIGRLESLPAPGDGPTCFSGLIGDETAGVQRPDSRLRADRCDLITPSAGVDPIPFLPKTVQDTVTNPSLLFPSPAGWSQLLWQCQSSRPGRVHEVGWTTTPMWKGYLEHSRQRRCNSVCGRNTVGTATAGVACFTSVRRGIATTQAPAPCIAHGIAEPRGIPACAHLCLEKGRALLL